MSYIKRNLENVINQVTREYPVVLVTGLRQVGKTTMLQKLMEGTKRGYVTLDDLNERALAYIKMSVDKNHEPGSFWLIGLQIFKLMRGVQESLAGRVAVLSMTSFSQAEIAGGEMERLRLTRHQHRVLKEQLSV